MNILPDITILRATGIMEVPEDSDPLRKLFSALHSNLAVCYSKVGTLTLQFAFFMKIK